MPQRKGYLARDALLPPRSDHLHGREEAYRQGGRPLSAHEVAHVSQRFRGTSAARD
jgi:hypothetical protein